MAAPFISIGTYRLKEGQLGAFTRYLRDAKFFELIETSEPRLLAFHGYANEDGTEIAFVQVHPDAASMELHMQVAREHIGRAYAEFLDSAGSSMQVYGQPSAGVLAMTRQLTGSGFPLNVKPQHLGGFTRLQGG